jgi:hypothetical protein
MARPDWKTLDEIGEELVKAAKELPKEDSRVAFARLMYLLSIPVGGLGKIGAK